MYQNIEYSWQFSNYCPFYLYLLMKLQFWSLTQTARGKASGNRKYGSSKSGRNAICGSSGLSIIGFMQVIEKSMGGLFALKDKYISGCKILANKQNWIIIILRL